MRKLAKVLLAGVAALSLTACGQAEGTTGSSADTTAKEQKQQETPEKIKIQSLNANGEEISLEVPYDPERIAVLDMAALDILDNLGVGDKIVGSASTSLEYLSDYVDNEKVANLGTIKEADLEAVMECEPEVIFIGGRLASSYDALSEIAPVVYLSTDVETGVVKSVTKNAETIASMFGLEDEVKEKTAGFDERIEAWAHGPVVPSQFNRFNNIDFFQNIKVKDCENIKLKSKTEQLLNEVVGIYNKYTDRHLELLVKIEVPWRETRGNIPEFKKCQKEIRLDLMKQYYINLN